MGRQKAGVRLKKLRGRVLRPEGLSEAAVSDARLTECGISAGGSGRRAWISA